MNVEVRFELRSRIADRRQPGTCVADRRGKFGRRRIEPGGLTGSGAASDASQMAEHRSAGVLVRVISIPSRFGVRRHALAADAHEAQPSIAAEARRIRREILVCRRGCPRDIARRGFDQRFYRRNSPGIARLERFAHGQQCGCDEQREPFHVHCGVLAQGSHGPGTCGSDGAARDTAHDTARRPATIGARRRVARMGSAKTCAAVRGSASRRGVFSAARG